MEFDFLCKHSQAQAFASKQVESDSCNFRLSRKYQIYYGFFRPFMPIFVRQMLQRGRQVETQDDWYLPTEFMRSLKECLASGDPELTTIHPWPNGTNFSFVLTHDVETSEGMKHIGKIADFEESLGFRSSWNLVPYKYKIDMGLVNDLQARGFEIGIHGYNHDGRLYSSQRVFERRAIGINKAIKKYRAVGFRSPMVHRNLNWLQQLDIEYDSSCFDIDPFQASPGGVGMIWPFVAGRFVELPYTMPQDHTLFVGLGLRDDQIWKNKLDYIVRHQGMALMLTHPDYLVGYRESEIYFRFLEYVKSVGQYWHATPAQAAWWWREREQRMDMELNGNHGTASSLQAIDRSVLAGLHLNGDGLQFQVR